LEFNDPRQVWVASDGHVFVADRGNNRVQVLTPHLDFHSFVGAGQLECPVGVCANADVVVVSERDAHRVRVFSRHSGARVAEFGCQGSGDGQLDGPQGVCFLAADALIAVADFNNSRVSVFSIHGAFVRHVGVGVLHNCCAVACSALDELVVADTGNSCVRLFSSSWHLVRSFGSGLSRVSRWAAVP
jgi:tripartite motif-containing protein 2/3